MSDICAYFVFPSSTSMLLFASPLEVIFNPLIKCSTVSSVLLSFLINFSTLISFTILISFILSFVSCMLLVAYASLLSAQIPNITIGRTIRLFLNNELLDSYSIIIPPFF